MNKGLALGCVVGLGLGCGTEAYSGGARMGIGLG